MDKEDIISLLKVTDGLSRLGMKLKEITGSGYGPAIPEIDIIYNVLEKYAEKKNDVFFDVICDDGNDYEDKYGQLYKK